MTVLKILVIPGFGQNAALLSRKYRMIRDAVGGAAEMFFVDPTHVGQVPTRSSADLLDSVLSDPHAADTTPRTRTFAEGQESRHVTISDESLLRLRYILETQGPFDAIWGFSMGAAMTAIVAALLERPHLYPIFAEPGPNWLPRPLKFVVVIAGYLLEDPAAQSFYRDKISTSSSQILDRAATYIGPEHSLPVPLVNLFQNPRIEWHDGGHHISSETCASWCKFYEDYVEAFVEGTGEVTSHLVTGPNILDSIANEREWELIGKSQATGKVKIVEVKGLNFRLRPRSSKTVN